MPLYDSVKVIGQGSASGTTANFQRPYEPYPMPVLDWADRVFSEHQMRPGLVSGNLVGGKLKIQDFGVPADAGFIEIQAPFITTALKNALWTIWHSGGVCHVYLPDDGNTYECLMTTRPQTPRRTSRCSEVHDSPYSYSQRFRVLGEV